MLRATADNLTNGCARGCDEGAHVTWVPSSAAHLVKAADPRDPGPCPNRISPPNKPAMPATPANALPNLAVFESSGAAARRRARRQRPGSALGGPPGARRATPARNARSRRLTRPRSKARQRAWLVSHLAHDRECSWPVARHGRAVRPVNSDEIAVHPDRELTLELILAIAISAPFVARYFARPSRGGGGWR